MLVNIHHDSAREHLRLLVAGIVYVLVIALLIGLSIAIYDKKFARVEMITIKADRAGLQLVKFGDVRRHGVLIGQVRQVSQDGDEASIEVALQPKAAADLPANVSVQIIPTTLFGQKFVSIVDPKVPEGKLEAGTVIPASRVTTNVELSQVLARLFPLLRTVRPADLNMTLNALATALEGRGEQLGDTLSKLNSYLDEIKPVLPAVRTDLQRLAVVARTYDIAAPDLLDVLRNSSTTFSTVLDKRRQLDVFFSDVTGLSTVSRQVLARNEADLIRLGKVQRPVLDLLATYSPEFPCLLKGAARYAPILNKTFEGGGSRQFYSIGARQYQPYTRDDKPVYGDVGHGPWCLTLPGFGDFPPAQFDNGTDLDETRYKYSPIPVLIDPATILDSLAANGIDLGGILGGLPGVGSSPRALPGWALKEGFHEGMSSGSAGSPAEQMVLNAALAERSRRSDAHYGSLGSLLYGPVVRGVVHTSAGDRR
ncbi:MCE family protein [Nocardioides acrostichi]|uniref:MCE family protein n=1 Tax=Nocardioides acrostichi TaxID=2784339 RepID=A0A930V1S3_9ACTN|nr:MCE family protein [Nocardioides acrostichi]MBF4162150.1 MCE family protein [Nocardioides acrostichi]